MRASIRREPAGDRRGSLPQPVGRRRDRAPDRDVARARARRGRARASRRPRRASPCPVASPAPADRCRSRATRSARPDDEPGLRARRRACRRENVTRSAPAASRSLGIGSCARPNGAVSSRAPEPRSSTTTAPCRCAAAASSAASGASTNPAWRKFDGWTRSTSAPRPSASAASKSAARVRFVVPTSTSRAPARRTISGMRTPPPISTSSPRRHDDAAATGEPDRERDGGRVVVRDERILGAGERDEVLLGRAVAAAAAAGLAVELEQQVPAAASRAASIAAAGHGARPRFVWTMTPVALMTRAGPAIRSSARGVRRPPHRAPPASSARRTASGRQARALLVHDGARHREHRRRVAPGRGGARGREHALDAGRARAGRRRSSGRRPPAGAQTMSNTCQCFGPSNESPSFSSSRTSAGRGRRATPARDRHRRTSCPGRRPRCRGPEQVDDEEATGPHAGDDARPRRGERPPGG